MPDVSGGRVTLPDNGVRPAGMTVELDAVPVPRSDGFGCPRCGGRWLYRLSFEHDGACPIGVAEQATAEQDAEWGASGGSSYIRPATREEIDLLAAVWQTAVGDVAEFHAPDVSRDRLPTARPIETLVGDDGGPVLHRRIGVRNGSLDRWGVDVDLLVSPAEYDALVDQTLTGGAS